MAANLKHFLYIEWHRNQCKFKKYHSSLLIKDIQEHTQIYVIKISVDITRKQQVFKFPLFEEESMVWDKIAPSHVTQRTTVAQ